ncbi:MAG: hypothetical protein JWO35_152 [Candidatus Saccharibacteria bacterium]|nr:hypothetical protein [Candidatus Saccharibacteria bacterium]
MVKIKKQSKLNKKILLLALIVIAIAGGGFYAKLGSDNKVESAKNTAEKQKINYDPPTAEDNKRVDDNKQRIVNQQQQQGAQTPQDTTTKKSVTPIISYAEQTQAGGNIEVGGRVSGVFEDGGTCTATFTQGSKTFVKSSTGVKNVSDVACPALSAAFSEFLATGSWSVTLSYASSTATGSSAARIVEVR